jgi:hypothetical protein
MAPRIGDLAAQHQTFRAKMDERSRLLMPGEDPACGDLGTAGVPHRGMPGHSRMVRGTVGPMSGAEWLASDIGRKRFSSRPLPFG